MNGGVLDPRWDDYYLLRFLRARQFKRKETIKMWTDYIEWRKKNNIDEIKVNHIFILDVVFPIIE